MIDIDDDIADSNEPKRPDKHPTLETVRPVLDSEKESDDCNLPKADTEYCDDLSYPGPEVRFDELRPPQQEEVVSHPPDTRYRDHGLSDHACDLSQVSLAEVGGQSHTKVTIAQK